LLATPNATQANLTWQVPASLRSGRYTATVAVLDNGCPLASEEQTLSFLVRMQVLANRPAFVGAASAFPTPFQERVQFQAASGGQLVHSIDGLGRTGAQLRAGAYTWHAVPTAARWPACYAPPIDFQTSH
jgi:hypothetical protein